jgi:hypothetical protein
MTHLNQPTDEYECRISAVSVFNNVLYVGLYNGKLYEVDGRKRKLIHTTPKSIRSMSIHKEELAFCTESDIYLMNLRDKTYYTVNFEPYTSLSRVHLGEPLLLVADYGGKLHIYEKQDQYRFKRSKRISKSSLLDVRPYMQNICAITDSGKICIYKEKSDKVTKTKVADVLYSMLVWGDIAIVGDDEGYIHFFRNGTVYKKVYVDRREVQGLYVMDGNLYVICCGFVYRVKDSGEKKVFGSMVYAPSALFEKNGELYFHSDDSILKVETKCDDFFSGLLD